MASLNAYSIVDIPITHDGTGNLSGSVAATYTYRTECSQLPVIYLGAGNATFTTKTLSTPASGVAAAIDAKHSICVWAATDLVCQYNGMLTVDFTPAKQLKNLDILNNKLVALNTTGLTKLLTLKCSYNPITSLDVSTSTVLTGLYCTGTALTSLNTAANTLLSTLVFDLNAVTAVDWSTNTALAAVNGDSNALTTVSLTNNTLITVLRLRSNSLTQTAVNDILSTLDSHGLSGGQLNIENQTTGAVIDTGTAAATSAQSLKDKGWTVTYSGTFEAA